MAKFSIKQQILGITFSEEEEAIGLKPLALLDDEEEEPVKV